MEPYLKTYLNTIVYPWGSIIIILLGLQVFYWALILPWINHRKKIFFPHNVRNYNIFYEASSNWTHQTRQVFPLSFLMGVLALIIYTSSILNNKLEDFVDSNVVDITSSQFRDQVFLLSFNLTRFLVSIWALALISWSFIWVTVFYLIKLNRKNINDGFLKVWNEERLKSASKEDLNWNTNKRYLMLQKYLAKQDLANYHQKVTSLNQKFCLSEWISKLVDEPGYFRHKKSTEKEGKYYKLKLREEYRFVVKLLTGIYWRTLGMQKAKRQEILNYFYFQALEKLKSYNYNCLLEEETPEIYNYLDFWQKPRNVRH